MKKKVCRFCGVKLTNKNWWSSCQKRKDYCCKICSCKISKKYHSTEKYKKHLKEYHKKYYQLNKKQIDKKTKIWQKNNPEKLKQFIYKYRKTEKGKKTYRNRILKQQYGITLEEYNKLFQVQNGCCAICGQHQSEFKKTLCVDHDHKTGKVRGLLCYNCNLLLGNAKEDVNILKNATIYIEPVS